MEDYKADFLEFAIAENVLSFGEFTLKSGRISPYFFNFGLFKSGSALSRLGRFYAQSIIDSGVEFDMLFGPAYKGIPLVAVTAAALYEHHDKDYSYAFNRKEAKKHGEGGSIVGAPLEGRVLVVDDVMTAGTAIREAADIVNQAGAEFAGVAISLDRQEKGQSKLSAVQEVEKQFAVTVSSIVGLNDVIQHVSENIQDHVILDRIQSYRERYGV
jgi:orotate phosphoribosyltransferase